MVFCDRSEQIRKKRYGDAWKHGRHKNMRELGVFHAKGENTQEEEAMGSVRQLSNKKT